MVSKATIRGVGLHTGVDSIVYLHPAPLGAGIRFRLPGGVDIPAFATHVVDTGRCTVLGTGGDRIATVEHLLSACAGLGVTDLLVEVSNVEMPIGDGSARLWVDALRAAGLTPVSNLLDNQPGDRLDSEIVVVGEGGAFIAAYPSDRTRLTVGISFPHPLVGTQVARFVPGATGETYATDIADARTFGFIEEVEALRASGRALGGTLENALVVFPDHYSSPLRYENEPARHKLLDLMGDLMLSGSTKLPIADIIAVKPSHRLNVAMALRLLEQRRGGNTNEG